MARFNTMSVKFVGSLLLIALYGAPAHAQATRTWVSGVGDDANPCSRTAPCKTFAGAISKTAANGEINCIDPGGFGAVTITKAMTIDCDGTFGSILNAGGVNGVIINAGVNDKIVLRNLKINGAGTGLNGIRFLAGKQLSVERLTIEGQTTRGIDIAMTTTGTVFVRDTIITEAATGLSATRSAGISVTSWLDNVRIDGMTGNAVEAAGNGVFIVIRNSSIVGSGGAAAATTIGTGVISIEDSLLTHNASGVNAVANGSNIRIDNNAMFDNTTAITFTNGTVSSAGNNRIVGVSSNPNGTAITSK